MRIFKNKWITKFADKQGISDSDLIYVAQRAESGRIDADLGGGVIKQRIARKGQGKSGGYRSLILFKRGNRAFFVYAFAKSDRENISIQELKDLKSLAAIITQCSDAELESYITKLDLKELKP
ncbi:MAG: type II toxin-antitoxin system RelE/ParE family toxin [Neisseria zoodegmatis]|uniref:type II toxin-antitoxin system RelE/ParE family toxin n=1 Tax=Neisseria zoodegmatis TaxID=326523 RepID=UPI0026EE00A5|nr:type II toxin-antitoxin system RelE/ParE family toxin [Neisseria zoodegmatis]MDO5070416.1 type II toxin-antitoxin system RelE/ParE family toxin [Neisseria zoodegmatis]